MKLVIVESPTKAKTISRFLKKEYTVLSSYGHIRDLPKGKLGVEVEKDFEPQYIIPQKAKKNVEVLKKASVKAKKIILATDEDREGEAIAFHLKEILSAKNKKVPFERITFHEITPSAIEEALENPREIDEALYDAQQARRVLDRLVGYKLSPFLWKKVRKGLSAGRVQSVAVRLIVERERERENFKAEEFWRVKVFWDQGGDSKKPKIEIVTVKEKNKEQKNSDLAALLTKVRGKSVARMQLKTQKEVEEIVEEIAKNAMKVSGIQSKESLRTPPPPFRTSTLQQEAGRKLGFSAKKTMMIAQQLYEGIKIDRKQVGLITYMRTDSIFISNKALPVIKEVIEKEFGKEYALATPRFYKQKIKGAQEAHEAIRPTFPERTPRELESTLSRDQFRLYQLIWNRAVACQMAQAKVKISKINFSAGPNELVSEGIQIIFDGFFKVLGKGMLREGTLPEVKEGETVTRKLISGEQNFTEPPARYTEATLIKALEENGVGRPSTYAPTLSTIQLRGYIARDEKKYLFPEEIGCIVNDILVKHFPEIVEIKFTAKVEEELDEIAKGKTQWTPMVKNFYLPFEKNLKSKEKEVKKFEKQTDKVCPECGKPMMEKFGRFGKFYACSGFPDCKHTEASEEDKKLEESITGEKCPECGSDLKLKRSKWGKFLGCANYPTCKFIKKFENKTGVKCPECGEGELVQKNGRRGPFYACNQYPKCKYIAKGDVLKQINQNKPTKSK